MSGADIAAIVLAAGRGTRFGPEPKMLARLGGTPLVRHVVEAALGARVDPLIVVTGEHGAAIRAALADLPVRLVENPDFAEGLSTSLRRGFAALPAEGRGVLVLLGDMPGVSAGLIRSLVSAWRAAREPAALVPTYRGRRGNPVLLSRRLEPDIVRLTGDAGAGPILRGRADVLEWATQDPAVAADIDTPEALAQADVVSTTPPRMAE